MNSRSAIPDNERPRSFPWLLFLLSVAAPGAGYLRARRFPDAIAAHGAWLGLLVATLGWAMKDDSTFRLACFLMLLLILAQAFHGAALASRLGPGAPDRAAPPCSWTWILLLALGLNGVSEALWVQACLPCARYRPMRIASRSMEPALRDGETIMVESPWTGRNLPRRGELVIFEAPPQPGSWWVMRCVALPGDLVTVRENGVQVQDAPCPEAPAGLPASAGLGTMQVPEGAIFCLGDNRGNSYDSRFWGVLPLSALRGRPLYVLRSGEPGRRGVSLS